MYMFLQELGRIVRLGTLVALPLCISTSVMYMYMYMYMYMCRCASQSTGVPYWLVHRDTHPFWTSMSTETTYTHLIPQANNTHVYMYAGITSQEVMQSANI